MPRDLPIGNGSLLIGFDGSYTLRDLYWPHVGKENHSAGHAFRFGVWADGQFRWLSDAGWQRDLRYRHDTLVTHIQLFHPDLQLRLTCEDAVDFHENLFIRRIVVTDLANQGRPRQVRLFFHHDFHISENEVGDTAYYEPERRAVLHYKGARWFLANGCRAGEPHGIDQWATGSKEMDGAEGTWRDAEDGQLQGNPIAQGSVDSTIALHATVPAGGECMLYYWLAVGNHFEEVTRINRIVREKEPQTFIERTDAYWRLWLKEHEPDLNKLPHSVCDCYNRSLLILRTQIDNNGAVVAANDTDNLRFNRDTYSYVWPRDGALVAHALDLAGYFDTSRRFFNFCYNIITKEGYFLHKYTPDGSLGSSWQPWYGDGKKELPIQEDETGLVIWALWEHFQLYKDVEFIKPLYRGLIIRATEWMASYRDPQTGLPLPSYDLWEERRGVLTFTVAATWAGLQAGANFAQAFGETALADKYRQAAAEIKAGAEAHLWRPEVNRFARMIVPRPDASYTVDATIDSSLFGLFRFGMYAADDPKVMATMQAVHDRLWARTPVGGMARYYNDYYHQVSQDIANVPGNPWFVCTLWLAEWMIAKAQVPDDLKPATDILAWAADHALPSGVLAEQINPYTGAPMSVSPLTWSHATFVLAVQAYLNKRAQLAHTA